MLKKYDTQNLFVFAHKDELFVGFYRDLTHIVDLFGNKQFYFEGVIELGPLSDYIKPVVKNDKKNHKVSLVTEFQIRKMIAKEERARKYAKKLVIKYNLKQSSLPAYEKIQ